MTNRDLQSLTSREELASTLKPLFPHLDPLDTALSPLRGGRIAAEELLVHMDPSAYERSRNFLTGQVTQLSAYLRHGVLTLAEVRDFALARANRPEQASKLINEFAWRDYWQRLYYQIGEGIWQDREPYKTGYEAAAYASELPQEVTAAETTLVCMDSFSRQLTQTGYLHNHARMWFAAYVVHWRRIAWQAGARWFLSHLVDGDPASNNLSWQWVASTFASKPYFFNRANLERYSAGAYCRTCPHALTRTCPFEQDYEALEQTLFPRLHDQRAETILPPPPRPFLPKNVVEPASVSGSRPLVWVHTDCLNPQSSIMRDFADAPAVFVWDTDWLSTNSISLKRIIFLAECLREMPGLVELRHGDPATELLAAAKAAGADHVVAQRTPDPGLLAAARTVSQSIPIVWKDPPAFIDGTRPFDLKRFSRYWQRAQPSAMQPTRN